MVVCVVQFEVAQEQCDVGLTSDGEGQPPTSTEGVVMRRVLSRRWLSLVVVAVADPSIHTDIAFWGKHAFQGTGN
jgi:hypothetical protein